MALHMYIVLNYLWEVVLELVLDCEGKNAGDNGKRWFHMSFH